ncbi:hypothetical protein CASFOL_022631 [Castilleja foliolosa]|uniref:Uncharacterized protein n=1 Tax=Castilleja foliolosa TaxID=1961234 RepID=A0ABD3CWB1_9LAMI
MSINILKKCCRKLKKFIQADKKNGEGTNSNTSPQPIQCDELFLRTKKRNNRSGNAVGGDNLAVRHQIAAQSHFSMRPNIYI